MRTTGNSGVGVLRFVCVLVLVGLARGHSPTETVLHTFGNFPNGLNPYGTPVFDSAGNLYGTASAGGAANAGLVYKLDAAGKCTVLYSFKGGTDGSAPYAGVTLDSVGNLYGTTFGGGGAADVGVVYKLSPSGQETVLYSFSGGNDGASPYAGVIADAAGNLYGTTYNGGAAKAGVVFKVSPSGLETVLYSFTGAADGAHPYAGVTADPAGNLYGTAQSGGKFLRGVLYKLDPTGKETVLHAFGNNPNHNTGTFPAGGVIFDAAGNLYGTTSTSVYKVDFTGKFAEVGPFLACQLVGGTVTAGVVLDAAGNIYGTSGAAQDTGACPSHNRFGTVFKIDTAGVLTKLYQFSVPPHFGARGYGPNSGVTLDAAGNLYGVSPYGQDIGGMLYKLDLTGQATTLFNFRPAHSGTAPYGSIIWDSTGNIYGTTINGGGSDRGVLYKVDPAGHETTLHSFPSAAGEGIARDSLGNIYGTAGGRTTGEIFGLDPSGGYKVLYHFTGGADGDGSAGVILDPAGNLYGVARGGSAPAGLVYRLNTSGQLTVLYTFTGGVDGDDPSRELTLDSEGNLYGTTVYGGTAGFGVVFKVDPKGHETVLHSFAGGPDGALPEGGVIRDEAGRLYGTTEAGGYEGESGGGTVFELDAAGNNKVLYTFSFNITGTGPIAGVVRDHAGNLYGTAVFGGAGAGCDIGCGVVYEVDPAGQETVLYSFTPGAGGNYPFGGVILDRAGNLYGAAGIGGTTGGGVVYKLTLQ